MTQTDTQQALFDAIKKETQAVSNASAMNPMQKAVSLERLSLAFRYLAGGPQPGGSTTSAS